MFIWPASYGASDWLGVLAGAWGRVWEFIVPTNTRSMTTSETLANLTGTITGTVV